jgi:hypothetical protein
LKRHRNDQTRQQSAFSLIISEKRIHLRIDRRPTHGYIPRFS